ncbi:glucose-1-phosphate adenylyltransferase [Candidatus Micrarchaeota archaeon]|nr:glucose-1-phosphate adenylyltransferase [Candidatus Micrarchaeota archaeon]
MKTDKELIAMLLAGGEGRRLGFLTSEMAKPALPFGGKYRIIDFTLSNCTNSGIDTVGVLTQYEPLILNAHIGIGIPWDLDRKYGGVSVLPPFLRGEEKGNWYRGTANAIYQNLSFINKYNPRYVLVLSGDHIYKMDYSLMLKFHKEKQADLTIAVIEVPWNEVGRFGIMQTDPDGRIAEFREKPVHPRSNLASMGIYIFNTDILKHYLQADDENPESSNDFGKDVIPFMLEEGCRLFAYPFQGYWKDVGTIESLWEANLDLLSSKNGLDLFDRDWRIYTINQNQPPHFVASGAKMENSLANEGCEIFGEVINSVLFTGVYIGEGTLVRDSVIMSNVRIGRNTRIERAIIDENAVIGDECLIYSGKKDPPEIILVKENMVLPQNSVIRATSL